ncbi:MmcQ/YjbR family DNA-binding protein [Mesorhizobium sp. BAC0120]|uniref:MmcQ/YjbR family DNA-binding protein n=1 Tax=Mesorhizobium sp. BAC0120 TaxID=3090670 RepID=UPI00298C8936|nr:MmcQ/YjbR family DNA-binding protein [Mesorhizobium sp. BAC0120]MDW6025666.1 MmcQ/YjbR family DNA-binding protein [Mesorhizobium sp. BAC0120]
MSDDLSSAFAKLKAAAEGLPEIEEGTSYGTPALKVRKKFLCRVRDPDTVVVMCPLEEKEVLMEAAPQFYFETDHYKGWPSMLVRVHAVPLEELALRLRRAWLMQAPKRLVKGSSA